MPSMMIRSGVVLLLWLGHAAANAADATAAQSTQTTRASAQAPERGERSERTSRRKPRILHLPSPSEESSAQRERRLTRECRGLPNAGACLGYASARARSGPARR